MADVYLGLGANLGARILNLRLALRRLGQVGRVNAVSSLYESEPLGGPAGQPPFLNAACLLRTHLSPRDLLAFLKALEREMGRWEGPRWGPRPLDLDILLYDQLVIKEEGLEVPHPRLPERPFVLIPLAEIAPEVRHPVLGYTMAQLAGGLEIQGLRLVLRPGWEEG
jgi:2-amino-4-hydroxy-6-hydroxymethyldihydropteridine diphosphokinase